jgi:dolichol kinase
VRTADPPKPSEARRKLVHAATAIFALPALLMPRGEATAAMAVLTTLAVALDTARLRVPAVARCLARLLPGVFRPDEAQRLSNASVMMVGYALATASLPGRAAVAGILTVALADAAAAVVGQLSRRWTHGDDAAAAPAGKTLAGSLACFVVTGIVVAGSVGPHPGPVLAGALAAALVERAVPGRWDNLVLPLSVGAAVALAAGR